MSDNQSLVADTDVPEEFKQLIVTHLEEPGRSFDVISLQRLPAISSMCGGSLLSSILQQQM